MADKMWDILRFLKNPDGETDAGAVPDAENERRRLNAQLLQAVERTEAAVDEAIGGETLDASVSSGESVFLTRSLDAEPLPAAPPEPAFDVQTPTEQDALPAEEAESRDLPDDAAAIPDAPPDGERLLRIPLDRIRPNPFQPRKVMGESEIIELSESIKELGVLQPILVREADGGIFELVAGERRFRAAQRAGLAAIPGIVVDVQPVEQQVIALVENIQRKNLTAIEEALCLQDIISKTGWSQTELSNRMGRSQASIANKLRLLRLDPAVQELVVGGKLGERQARSLLSLSMEEQRQLAQRAIDEDLSARALEALSETWNGRSGSPKKRAKSPTGASDGPAGELLGDVASMIGKYRSRGYATQWKVKQMNQSSLIIEISVDLLGQKTAGAKETEDGN